MFRRGPKALACVSTSRRKSSMGGRKSAGTLDPSSLIFFPPLHESFPRGPLPDRPEGRELPEHPAVGQHPHFLSGLGKLGIDRNLAPYLGRDVRLDGASRCHSQSSTVGGSGSFGTMSDAGGVVGDPNVLGVPALRGFCLHKVGGLRHFALSSLRCGLTGFASLASYKNLLLPDRDAPHGTLSDRALRHGRVTRRDEEHDGRIVRRRRCRREGRRASVRHVEKPLDLVLAVAGRE